MLQIFKYGRRSVTNPYFCNTAYWAADWVELSLQAQNQHKKQSSKTVGADLGYILHNPGYCDFFVYFYGAIFIFLFSVWC